MNDFETIEDSALEQVTGGLSFSIGSLTVNASLTDGISADGLLGASISVPSPFTIAGDLIGEVTGAASEVLTRFADRLSSLGQLFDFS